jgi:hypothetical protein
MTTLVEEMAKHLAEIEFGPGAPVQLEDKRRAQAALDCVVRWLRDPEVSLVGCLGAPLKGGVDDARIALRVIALHLDQERRGK